MVAFKDRHANKWKVLETGTEEDVRRRPPSHVFWPKTSQDGIRPGAGQLFELRALAAGGGSTKEARQALVTALSASPKATDPAWPYSEVTEALIAYRLLLCWELSMQ